MLPLRKWKRGENWRRRKAIESSIKPAPASVLPFVQVVGYELMSPLRVSDNLIRDDCEATNYEILESHEKGFCGSQVDLLSNCYSVPSRSETAHSFLSYLFLSKAQLLQEK